MFSDLLLLVTAILGFLSTALIFGKNKYQEHSLINKYLIIITGTNAVRFLFHWIAEVFPKMDITEFVTLLDVGFIMLMPCFYLYFTNIIYEKKFELNNLLHFIVPLLLGTLFIFILNCNNDKSHWIKIIFIFFVILFYITYTIAGFKLLYKHIWLRKTVINAIQKQNDLMKQWSLFLYISFILIFIIRVNLSFITYRNGTSRDHYLWIPAIIWIIIFIKIIITPEILYGYNLINKTIDAAKERIVLNSVWNLKDTVIAIASEKDKKLEEKIKPMLVEYVHKIEEYSFYTTAFRNPDLSVDDIAVALKIPISNVNFVLKFHCNESFTDYKKIVRIHDATKLLEDGYLSDHKVETLSYTVGFTSYNTFSIAFKNITGLTTQEYLKRF